MRVGIVLQAQDPQSGGGQTFRTDVLRALAREADSRRHSFVISVDEREMDGLPSSEAWTIHRRVQVRPKRGIPLVGRLQRAVGRLRNQAPVEVARTPQVDAFLAQGVHMLWSLAPEKTPLELPFVTTVWDLQHRIQPFFPEVSLEGQWERRELMYSTVLRRAAFVITGTEEGKAEIEAFYQIPSQRIRVLPLPTPEFALRQARNSTEGTTQGLEEYLLYPAQFWPHKNHINALEALRILRDRFGLILPLVLVGSDKGNLEHVIRRAAKLDLSTQVRYLGFVSQDQLAQLYRDAFALLFPTFFGPDNLPPLEAFAFGCPVIASDIPGAREQLGTAALLVDPRSSEAIAQAIKSLRDTAGLRQTLVTQGLARAAKWTSTDYVRGVFDILDEFEVIRRCWTDTELYRPR